MRYRIDFQRTHDIDWVGKHGGIPLHVASNGGRIPNVVDSRHNRDLLTQIYATEEFLSDDDIVVNKEGIRYLLNHIYEQLRNSNRKGDNVFRIEVTEEMVDRYAASFVRMAKRGFVSVDRYDYSRFDNTDCIVIAYPKRSLNIVQYWKEQGDIYENLPAANIRVYFNNVFHHEY